MAVASDLRDGRIERLHYRPPGYPLLLLASGSGEKPTRALFVVSLVLHFGSIWILASVLHAIGLPAAALGLFGLLLLLPPYVEPAAYVLTENLAAFTLAAGFGALACWCRGFRTAWLVIAAIAIGYSGLIRPTYQALGIVAAAMLVLLAILCDWHVRLRRRVLKAALVLAGASIVIVGGYGSLNYLKFGHFGLSLIAPVDSATLSTRTARFVERLPDEHAAVREVLVRARDAELVKRGGQHTGYAYLSSPGVVQELTKTTGLQGPELAKYLLRLNLLLIREAPLEYLYDVSRAFGQYWFPTATSLANMNSPRLQLLWAGLQFGVSGLFGLTLVILIGGLPYWAIRLRARWMGAPPGLTLTTDQFQGFACGLAGTIVLYTAVLSTFFETGDPRYRVPTEGLIIAMIFLGVHLCSRAVACLRGLCDSGMRFSDRS